MVLLRSFAGSLCAQHPLSFKVLLVKTMYLHWSTYRSKSAVSLSILLRVAAFSLFRVVVAVYNLSLTCHHETLTRVLVLQRIRNDVIFNPIPCGKLYKNNGCGIHWKNGACQFCSPCLGWFIASRTWVFANLCLFLDASQLLHYTTKSLSSHFWFWVLPRYTPSCYRVHPLDIYPFISANFVYLDVLAYS